MRIPLSAPDVTEEEIAAVAVTLRSSQLSIGPRLEEFETAFTQLTGVDHATGVSSGTAGMHLAVRALGIGKGDEVIVPSFTFIAVANAVRYERATPIFVDIDEDSLNLSVAAVERAITSRTRAIVAVHTFGRPAEMPALRQLAERHGLALIEDACEAIGAESGGQPAGSLGDVAVFGFYPNKQITTGEGGMVVTRDARLAARIRALRNQGRGPGGEWLQHEELGYNYRLSEIAATLGTGQMRRLQGILARRAEVARLYDEALAGATEVRRPALSVAGVRLSWFVYVVRLGPARTAENRDRVILELAERGIGCGRYFAPIHRQPAYAGWPLPEALPVTEMMAARTIALPFFNRIDKSQIEEVAETLAWVLNRVV